MTKEEWRIKFKQALIYNGVDNESAEALINNLPVDDPSFKLVAARIAACFAAFIEKKDDCSSPGATKRGRKRD